jgi:hypothetical protein
MVRIFVETGGNLPLKRVDFQKITPFGENHHLTYHCKGGTYEKVHEAQGCR